VRWPGAAHGGLLLAVQGDPLDFLLFHCRDGTFGAVASGVGYGMFCLGCCSSAGS